jgi:hypothetical protein
MICPAFFSCELLNMHLMFHGEICGDFMSVTWTYNIKEVDDSIRPVLRIRDGLSRIRIRPLLHPGSGSRIRGVKKHRIPDPSVHKNRDEK